MKNIVSSIAFFLVDILFINQLHSMSDLTLTLPSNSKVLLSEMVEKSFAKPFPDIGAYTHLGTIFFYATQEGKSNIVEFLLKESGLKSFPSVPLESITFPIGSEKPSFNPLFVLTHYNCQVKDKDKENTLDLLLDYGFCLSSKEPTRGCCFDISKKIACDPRSFGLFYKMIEESKIKDISGTLRTLVALRQHRKQTSLARLPPELFNYLLFEHLFAFDLTAHCEKLRQSIISLMYFERSMLISEVFGFIRYRFSTCFSTLQLEKRFGFEIKKNTILLLKKFIQANAKKLDSKPISPLHYGTL